MCGKFTAMFSYAEVVAFSQPLGGGDDDKEVTYRVVGKLPVIVLDIVENKRRVVPMRWGFSRCQRLAQAKADSCTLRDGRYHQGIC
jgi:hypothetical protein